MMIFNETKLLLLSCLLLLSFQISLAQSGIELLEYTTAWPPNCESTMDASTQKYWQYRNNFNKHFIKIDREVNGATSCVNNGIYGENESACEVSKSGLSLPGTAIIIDAHGWNGQGDRNAYDGPGNNKDINFADGDCWTSTGNGNHNYLDVGSETPTQLGWYIQMLCTEYALFQRNSQYEEAKKTLEELFLALQAVRRLDIAANCMIADYYKFRRPENLVGIDFCPREYYEKTHFSFDRTLLGKNLASEPFKEWLPDVTGYSGFILREDATQDLASIHDPTEDKYNIEFIASNNALSSKPCNDNSIAFATCYNIHHQNFISQDQIIGLFNGLVFVKKFIEPTATVTTCDGSTHNVLQIAQNISKGFAEKIAAAYKHRIEFPGTHEWEDQIYGESAINLNNSEGGEFLALFPGIAGAHKYITGEEVRVASGAKLSWAGTRLMANVWADGSPFTGLQSRATVALFSAINAISGDRGDVFGNEDTFFEPIDKMGHQILALINNTLYPGSPNCPFAKDDYVQMLCAAPCEGQCYKQGNYPDSDPEFPEFECPNSFYWRGQRWDGSGAENGIFNNNIAQGLNKVFNGLDYMVLHNLMLLNYPELTNEPFIKPDGVNVPSLGYSYMDKSIIGSNTICLNDTKYYSIKESYSNSVFENISWTSTNDLTIQGLSNQLPNIPVKRVSIPAANVRSELSVAYTEVKEMKQIFTNPNGVFPNGNGPADPNSWFIKKADVSDHCQLNAIKIIGRNSVSIRSEPKYCGARVFLYDVSNSEEIISLDDISNITWSSNGVEPDVELISGSNDAYFINNTENNISLNVVCSLSVCNAPQILTKLVGLPKCDSGGGKKLRIVPNPNSGTFGVFIDGPNIAIPPNGLNMRVLNPVNGAVLINSVFSSNGQQINASQLNSGSYILQTNYNGTVLNANLFITN